MGRCTCAVLIAGLALSGCGSTTPTPSQAAVVAVALATPSPAPTTSPSASASEQPSASPNPTPTPLPSGSAAGIDGVMRPAKLAFRSPLAVLIDDNVVARPQAGFNAAALVYQAPADGGEDRYMFVFQGDEARKIGPVRSGRPFFLRWAAEYRAGLAHYGGDYMTLGQTIPQLDGTYIYDIDALRGSNAAFHRIKTRAAPHNAYTNTNSLRTVGLRRGMPATQTAGFGVRAYVDDAPLADRPARATISVPYPRGASGYTYDRARNLYLRSVAGRVQVDAGDGKRVTARNIVVLFMRKSIDANSEPHHARIVLDQIGSGPAMVFREGRSWKATWRKDSAGDITRLLAADGTEIALVRGRTFFQVVPTGTKITVGS
jgi:Protein of unknown function (DUF3048).